MGTRADFYVGRGPEAEWLGSIAHDGYPEEVGVPMAIRGATTEEEFRQAVATHLQSDNATLPEQGWPWPWEDSSTTDYAYAFEDGKVHGSSFGHFWWDADNPPSEEKDMEGKVAVFPNMKHIQKVTFGPRSGLLILSAPLTKTE